MHKLLFSLWTITLFCHLCPLLQFIKILEIFLLLPKHLILCQLTSAFEPFKAGSETIPWTIAVHWNTGIVIAPLWRSSWKFNINVFSLRHCIPPEHLSRIALPHWHGNPNINSYLLRVPLNPPLLPRCNTLTPPNRFSFQKPGFIAVKWCLEVEEKLKHYKQKIQTVTHRGRHDQNQNWMTSFKWNSDIRNESKYSSQASTCSKVSICEFSHMKLILWLKTLKS